jgi:hypothetical protein
MTHVILNHVLMILLFAVRLPALEEQRQTLKGLGEIQGSLEELKEPLSALYLTADPGETQTRIWRIPPFKTFSTAFGNVESDGDEQRVPNCG